MIYKDYERNHAIVPGREAALAAFLDQDYKGMRHMYLAGDLLTLGPVALA